MINKKTILRTALSSVLSAGLLLSQPVCLWATDVTASTDPAAETTVSDPTPTLDPHTSFYYQEPESNQIKDWPAGPNIEAESGILMDISTGTIMYAKNIDKQMYPASITKVMTALLASEYLEMDAHFTMSYAAAFGIEPGSSSIYGDADEEFTVEQAMMGLMLESANEMALALGEEVSGSVKKFVELMNERARQLGCTNTHFNNPNGLPDETHYTSAHDMALIARAAYLNPIARKVMSTSYYEIPPTNRQPETRYLLNHHRMMAGKENAYEGVIGGKTGYTVVAGNTLVTYAKRGNMALVAVVLQSVGGGYADTAALLDYGFNNFERISMGWTKEPSVTLLPAEKYILNTDSDKAAFYSLRAANAMVPLNTRKKSLGRTTSILEPIGCGYRIETQYYYNDHPVGLGIRYEKEILSDLLS